MWTSVALAASLMTVMPGGAAKDNQESKLKISHARFLYSGLGMERDGKFLPGDDLVMGFDIDNLARDAKTGKVVYGIDMEFRDSKDKRAFRRNEPNNEELNALGGTSFATFVLGTIGRDTPPGEYTLQLKVTDQITKKNTKFKRKFEVLKKALGLVRVQIPAMGFVGQPFAIKFSVEGFRKDDRKMPKLTLRVDMMEGKEPTLVRPIDLYIPKDLDEDVDAAAQKFFDLGAVIRLTRPGKFTILLIATDHVAKKTVRIPYKLTVLDSRKYESAK
jgi:hypothetical protein